MTVHLLPTATKWEVRNHEMIKDKTKSLIRHVSDGNQYHLTPDDLAALVSAALHVSDMLCLSSRFTATTDEYKLTIERLY